MPIFATNWQATGADRKWRDSTVVLEHTLPRNPLLSMAALADLIETLPRENYVLMYTGPVGSDEEALGGGGNCRPERGRRHRSDQTREPVAAHTSCGRCQRSDVSSAAGHYEEIDTNVADGYPTFNAFPISSISSPSAQVYYHFDHNGQTLWQVHGSKRVYVYPNRPPFLTKAMLEYTALYADETAVPYAPWYDNEASVFELKAGQMIHWPLFSPHRVENSEFSVSYTTQYYTPGIRRLAKVHAGNGLLHTILPKLEWVNLSEGRAMQRSRCCRSEPAA